MKIQIKMDPQHTEPMVYILTDRVTDEVNALLQRLSETPARVMTGFADDTAHLLEPDCILRVFAEQQKVFAQTEAGTYQLRMRLYEAEEKLDSTVFVRISQSEILNLRQVASLDLSLGGTICIRMKNGDTAYASRRYVAKIKERLGI